MTVIQYHSVYHHHCSIAVAMPAVPFENKCTQYYQI